MASVDISSLQKQWRALLPDAGRSADSASRVFDELVAAYRSPGRHYHKLDHIAALLQLMAGEAGCFHDLTTVAFAVFFHDAVYDARHPQNNEVASADLARDRLFRLGIDERQCGKVASFVTATAHMLGAEAPGDPDLARFLDLDLAILAASPTDYDAYAAAIRCEYAHVPQGVYRLGRAKVLTTFLDRSRLFNCDDHHAAWDAPARANMRRELDRLQDARP